MGIFTVIITFHQEKIAAKQRAEDKESAHLLRELERSLANEQYQNELLDNYIKEMGELIKENNGSLTTNPTIGALARAKTLSIFRQLDSQRNGRIIRFLYESGQINENKEYSPLDLSTAELHNIDFSLSLIPSSLESISLSGIYLINVTFGGANLCKSNFSGSRLVDIIFSKSNLNNVDFTKATLTNITFFQSILMNSYFIEAKLNKIDFSEANLDNANFSEADLFNITFSEMIINGIIFSYASFKSIIFFKVSLIGFDFVNVKIVGSRFSNTDLTILAISKKPKLNRQNLFIQTFLLLSFRRLNWILLTLGR